MRKLGAKLLMIRLAALLHCTATTSLVSMSAFGGFVGGGRAVRAAIKARDSEDINFADSSLIICVPKIRFRDNAKVSQPPTVSTKA